MWGRQRCNTVSTGAITYLKNYLCYSCFTNNKTVRCEFRSSDFFSAPFSSAILSERIMQVWNICFFIETFVWFGSTIKIARIITFRSADYLLSEPFIYRLCVVLATGICHTEQVKTNINLETRPAGQHVVFDAIPAPIIECLRWTWSVFFFFLNDQLSRVKKFPTTGKCHTT